MSTANLIRERMLIPPAIYVMIQKVVEKDEGGWQLNKEDANDPDGGWTYGGITATLYNECFTPDNVRPIDRTTIEVVTQTGEGKAHLAEDCYQIYFKKFCVPLAKLMEEQGLHEIISEMELSCFINLGERNFLKVVKDAGDARMPDYKQKFLSAWRQFYCHLVGENAQAWKNYADAFDEVSRPTERIKPKTLRAVYLSGWIVRVDSYA